MDRNYDPRDEVESRPQVAFRLRAGAFDPRRVFEALLPPGHAHHDMMLLARVGDEVPGVVRFQWGAGAEIVDAAARHIASLPYVKTVFPSYGGPIDGP